MLEVRGLSKTFKVHQKEPGLMGSIRAFYNRKYEYRQALSPVDLEVKEGEILGLIGENGAGKTTLIKMLSGILFPSEGEAKIFGHTPWLRDNRFRQQLALVMGQKAQLWWDLPALDCFLLLKEIYQLKDRDFKQQLDYLVEMLGVASVLKIQIRKLSLGERMKMELVASLIHRPKIIFLDEPTIGLDLLSQKSVRDFIQQYQQEYRPITILTSHYLQDIESLCSRIMILKKGHNIYDGPLKAIEDHFFALKKIELNQHQFSDALIEQFKLNPADHLIESIEQNQGQLSITLPKENVLDFSKRYQTHFSIDNANIKNLETEEVIQRLISDENI
jgi:ABC-2 type transport system ATP-binding protein